MGVRKVPISFVGLASEVYLKGSFDGWGTGLRLSCTDVGSDVFTHFQGDLYVSPVGILRDHSVELVFSRMICEFLRDL